MNHLVKDSKTIERECDVCIIGDGFAGLNSARLMAKGNFTSNIVSSGMGASNFWLGSINILKTIKDSKGFDLEFFVKNFPNHPFRFTNSQIVQDALGEFYSEMTDLIPFRDNNKIFTNRRVLSPFGTLKQANGKWKSIFSEFNNLTKDSEVFLIDFKEFDLSAMYLVAKGLIDNYDGKYQVIEVSLKEIFLKINPDFFKKLQNKIISPKMVAEFFDSNKENMNLLIEVIRPLLYKNSFPITKSNKIILFPPIMGIVYNDEILKSIAIGLNCQCYEIMSITPSIISDCLQQSFKRNIENKNSLINWDKGFSLQKITKTIEGFSCTFENRKLEQMNILSKHVIIACGSIFADGIFNPLLDGSKTEEDNEIFANFILSNDFELKFREESINLTKSFNTGKIFAVGSSIFLFSPGFLTDDEIFNDTGMGTVIIPAYHIFKELIKIKK